MILLLYDTGVHSACLNMAIDDVLLQKKESVLRFYQWAGSAVTLGRFQKIREVNAAVIEKNGVTIVRRETGGKAVLHGEDLTISLMLDKDRFPGSIREAIKPVGRGIAMGLHSLGIEARQVSPGKRYPSSPYCFSIHSPYEVVVGNKKIAGIAGRVYREKILFQISIPFSINLKSIKQYFQCSTVNKPWPLDEIGLMQMLPMDCNLESVKRAIISGLRESLNSEITVAALTKAELEQAEGIAAAKYSRDEWNLER